MNSGTEVLVVGAGPTGLAMAAFLAAHGIQARIIDRNRDRARESRALAIQPRTLEALAGLGVTEKLIQAGNRNVTLCLHTGAKVHTVPMFDLGMADTAYPYLLFLTQAETERILAEYLGAAGITVERDTELADLHQQSGHVEAILRHPDGSNGRVTVQYLIGCDGAHSTVRQLAGIGFEGGSYPQTFVLADLEAGGIDPGAVHLFLSGHGMMSLLPLVDPASWRMLAMRPKHDPVPPAASVTLGEVQQRADAFTGGTVRLSDPVWMTNFRIHHRAATRYRTGQIFLAGDAAHVHSPAGAQGMNTGIQDAANLAWKIAYSLKAHATGSILDTYEKERAPIGRMVLRMSDRAFNIATNAGPRARFARTRLVPALIPLVLRANRARGFVWRAVSQLSIRYRRSPLSVSGPRTGRRIRAGDRLPDASLDNGSTLHELTSTPGWQLLILGTPTGAFTELLRDRATVVTVRGLRPSGPVLRQRLGLSPKQPAIILVRPDGYIGYLSHSTEPSGLKTYLDQWLPARGT